MLITGKRHRNGSDVSIDGRPLLHIVRHSPDGFEWGYGGSGPSDLARSILTEVVDREFADRWYQDFKFEFIAGIATPEWTMESEMILEWAETKRGS